MKTKRFFRLKFGEKFDFEGDTWQKESWHLAVSSYGGRRSGNVWPWEKVECGEPSELVKLMRQDARKLEAQLDGVFSAPSPFLDLLTGGKFPERDRTHYFGDGCYPPHVDDNRTGPSA